MIINHFIAIIFMCAFGGEPCVMYKDIKGPSDTRVECQVKMDALWIRITQSEDVAKQLGSFSANQFDHRGYCLNAVEDNHDMQIERWYEQ